MKSIPAVKTWSVKFYRVNERRPYAEIRVNAPTKFLAKLNARHCYKHKFYEALAALNFQRYTIGLVKALPKVTDGFDTIVTIDTDLEDQRAEMLQEMAEDAQDDVGTEDA